VVYTFDAAPPHGSAQHLSLVQRLPTRGAYDFHAFTIRGVTYLAVCNEQDEVSGADIDSTIWKLNSRHFLALASDSIGHDEL
jgi:hypothetical protein